MSWFKNKMMIPYTLIVVLLSAITTSVVIQNSPQQQESIEQLYAASIQDAMVAEKSEIENLVVIDQASDMVTWNDSKDKILLLSWHKYPSSYPENTLITMEYGETYSFTDKEIKQWYKDNHEGVKDWDMRLRQLIGLPPTADYTHVSAFWVDPRDVVRPAYIQDIKSNSVAIQFDENVEATYKAWFDQNIVYSYYECAYPWTRLGYTYDWGNPASEYGVSEFLIKKDAPVEVVFTKSTKQFIKYLQDN